ncbi:acyl carrier protein [Bremerella cremea]|uniref:Acyl carrier protein n=1 Tax=Bremerella cremea TaxID=1031537 RepID=A0A368KLY4_9BACT|nr:acyl carrier protein [Bremerella cremea]RCS40637.1 acyl carrier protein [Bremerella cremea]
MTADQSGPSGDASKSAEEIQDWIIDYLAKELDAKPSSIDPSATFDSFALDSATAIGMTGDLENWLGKRIDPTIVYDYPTIEEFSNYLAGQ